MSTFLQSKSFPIGELESFRRVEDAQLIQKMVEHPCFNSVQADFVARLKSLLPLFVARVNEAFKSSDASFWVSLCDEPKKQLKHFWKLDKKTPITALQHRNFTVMKNQSINMYYCLYVILFWRHPAAYKRYQDEIVSFDDFQREYAHDPSFTQKNLEAGGTRIDRWEQLFKFRNVLVLAMAVKPIKRNKGTFTKVACILAEGRVHSTGGGQSFASDRRSYIYNNEGDLFIPVISAHANCTSRHSRHEDDGDSDDEPHLSGLPDCDLSSDRELDSSSLTITLPELAVGGAPSYSSCSPASSQHSGSSKRSADDMADAGAGGTFSARRAKRRYTKRALAEDKQLSSSTSQFACGGVEFGCGLNQQAALITLIPSSRVQAPRGLSEVDSNALIPSSIYELQPDWFEAKLEEMGFGEIPCHVGRQHSLGPIDSELYFGRQQSYWTSSFEAPAAAGAGGTAMMRATSLGGCGFAHPLGYEQRSISSNAAPALLSIPNADVACDFDGFPDRGRSDEALLTGNFAQITEVAY